MSQQGNEMFIKIGNSLRQWRTEHGANFTGLVHVSLPDLQALFDATEESNAFRQNRHVRRRKMNVGDQIRISGVRVVGATLPVGTVDMDRQ
jgi:uncharacterized protein (UPF0303 family)